LSEVIHCQLDLGVSQMAPARREVLDELVRSMPAGRPLRLLEVGSYEGGSAVRWAASIAAHCGSGSVTCVDPWKPYLGSREVGLASVMDGDLASGVAFKRFLRNSVLAPKEVPICYLVSTFEDAFPALHGLAYDIVFVDGRHTYEAVLHDLKAGAALLVEGGLLCGDDLEVQLDQVRAVDRAGLAVDVEWNGQFHPGVTRAVGEFFGGRVWSREGAWAMRSVKNRWETPL
jgi:hypothetical protein